MCWGMCFLLRPSSKFPFMWIYCIHELKDVRDYGFGRQERHAGHEVDTQRPVSLILFITISVNFCCFNMMNKFLWNYKNGLQFLIYGTISVFLGLEFMWNLFYCVFLWHMSEISSLTSSTFSLILPLLSSFSLKFSFKKP
jgi:hypothetical protein